MRRSPLLVLALLLLASLGAATSAHAAPFALGVQDPRPADPAHPVARFDAMQGLGTDVTRLTLFWNQVASRCGRASVSGTLADPATGCYDWAAFDGLVDGARSRGLDVIVSVYGTPAWVLGSSDTAYVGTTNDEYARFQAQYAAFAQAAATRYSGAGAHGFVHYWTIWNEPNGGVFWRPLSSDAATRYADLYVPAATAIKAVSPAALVAPGPTAPTSKPQRPGTYVPAVLDRLEQLGATNLVDAWAHNPYAGGNVSPFAAHLTLPSIGIGNIDDLFGILDASPVTRGKPVWATEFAYETNPPDTTMGTSLENQAQWMAEAMDVAWSTQRMPIFEWYVLQDPNSDPSVDWNAGMFFASGAEKPSAAMYRRPISVRELSGGAIRVWGMSALSPDTAELVTMAPGTSTWVPLPAKHYEGNVQVATAKLPDGTLVAVRDAGGVGPSRDVAGALPDPVTRTLAGGGGSGTPTAAAAKPRLTLAQRVAKARGEAKCGRSITLRCTYARAARPTLVATATPRAKLAVRSVWELRTAAGWKRVVVLSHTTAASGTVGFGIPARVRARKGSYRVRVIPVKPGAAIASGYQYLLLR